VPTSQGLWRDIKSRTLGWWVSVVRVGAVVAFALAAGQGLTAAEHSGQVSAAGVPIPGATVTATQGERKIVTATDAIGAFSFPDLKDGVWTIRVEMPGFAPLTRDVTVVAGAEQTAWDLALLSFDEITRGVPMPAPAPPPSAAPAASTSASRGGSRTTSTPNKPGAAATPSTGSFQRAGVSASAAAPAAGAAPPDEPPPDPVLGATDGFLIQGSVNNGSASPFAQSGAFGNNRRALNIRPYTYNVGLSTRNSALDASPYTFGGPLIAEPDYYNLNLSGAVGGPLRIPGLIRNGPFFNLSYQRTTDQTATTSSTRLPSLRERTGDFSQTRDRFGNPISVMDPDTGLPFAGGIVPPERISPQAAALLEYYPSPNLDGDGQYNYQRAMPVATVTDAVSANINAYSFNPRNQLSGSFQFQRSHLNSANLFGFDDDTRRNSFNITAIYSYRFSPLMVLRARHTFGRQRSAVTPFFANVTNVSAEAGITGNNQDPENWGPPAINLSSVASLSTGLYSLDETDTNTSSIEVFRSQGRHALTMGAEVRRSHLDLVSQQNPRGSFFFGGELTGLDFADFLLGVPSTSQIAYGNADKAFRGFSYAAYISDDFRVGPSLTLNLGVRWEYETPFTEELGRLVNLDVASDFTAVSPVVASDPVGSLTGRSYPSSLVHPDKAGIQPRLAVAWRPILGSSIVVRGGYGIYRNNGIYQSLARALAQQPPVSYAVSSENTPETPLTLANGFIPSPSITPNTYAIDPDFRVSYGHVWQASMQRDLPYSLSVNMTYLGTKGVNMVQQFLPNTYAPGADNPCPTCPIGFAYVTSHGSSLRNQGQLQLRRRLRAGLTASVQYTLAKATDNAATFSGTTGRSAQDWLNLDAEHGPSNDDQRHQLGGQVQYTTGIGVAGGGMLDGVWGAIVKGWVLTGNIVVGSGRPLTPIYGTALPGTASNGSVRAALTGAPVDDIPDGYYLNPLAYGIPAAGSWGSAGRNSVRGPKQYSLNAGITRQFPINDRLNIDWQVNATNLLNQVTYNSVNTTLNSPQFGLPTTANDMRKIQTSIRARF
jgi:hypothetical protein